MPSLKLIKPTKICKLCFKEFEDKSLFHLSHDNINYCRHCLREMKAHFTTFKVAGYSALSIYRYDDKIQSLLYQLKGCYDIEIADVFLLRYKRELSLYFHSYVVVPIPSFEHDDKLREFNHVEEIFKSLNLPMKKLFRKTKKVKQADLTADKRKLINKYIELIDDIDLSKTRVLLVDDVYTTGSTIKACISLIQKLHPKNIKVLVMSKTESPKEKEESKHLLFDTR